MPSAFLFESLYGNTFSASIKRGLPWRDPTGVEAFDFSTFLVCSSATSCPLRYTPRIRSCKSRFYSRDQLATEALTSSNGFRSGTDARSAMVSLHVPYMLKRSESSIKKKHRTLQSVVLDSGYRYGWYASWNVTMPVAQGTEMTSIVPFCSVLFRFRLEEYGGPTTKENKC